MVTTRRRNLAEIIVCATLLIGLSLPFAPSIFPSVTPVQASSRTISLVGTSGAYYYWNNSNPTITVTQGDTLTIVVSSSDSVSHRLLIDLDKDGYTDVADCGISGGDVCSNMVPPSYTIPAFTINASPGTYTYYCTIHPTSMFGSFVIQSQTSSGPDFTITPSPTSLTVAQGASGTTTITLNSLNGFSGTVNLSTSVSPPGPQPSVNPTSVSLSAGGSASSTLTVSTSPSGGYYSSPVPQGTYAVSITASSGSLSHSTSVSLVVGSTSTPPAGNSNLPVLPIVGGIIGAIVIVGAAVFLIKRKK